MVEKTVLRHYRKFRANGGTTKGSLHCARIQTRWDELERRGLVRLEIVPDDSPDLSFLGEFSSSWQRGAIDRKKADGYLERNAYPYFIPAYKCAGVSPGDRAFASVSYREMMRAQNDGCWGVCGQWRMDEEEEWETADSCFGFIGNDWEGDCVDFMSSAIDAYESAVAAGLGVPTK